MTTYRSVVKNFRNGTMSVAASLSLAFVLAPAFAAPATADVVEDSWLLLAAGERASVLAPTTSNATTAHNGSEWYYTVGASMGFAPAGATISQSTADTAGTDPADETRLGRLSWHLNGTAVDPGWRVGELTNLNGSTDVYRAVYEASALPAYYPSGPQRNVPFASLDGWTLCWSGTYADTVALETLWLQCDGSYLLVAGGPGADPAAEPEPEPEPEPQPDPELAETGATDTFLMASLAAMLMMAGALVLRRARRASRA